MRNNVVPKLKPVDGNFLYGCREFVIAWARCRKCIGAVDLKAGWLDYPRPKTGVHRRCPLWKETREAIKTYLKNRLKPKDKQHADQLFITKHGRPFVDEGGNSGVIGGEFLRLVDRLNGGQKFLVEGSRVRLEIPPTWGRIMQCEV